MTSVARAAGPMSSGPFPVQQGLGPFETIQALHAARQRIHDVWRQTWVDQKLDVILAPGAQSTAVSHDTYGWPAYTVIWNVLDVSLSFSFCLLDLDSLRSIPTFADIVSRMHYSVWKSV